MYDVMILAPPLAEVTLDRARSALQNYFARKSLAPTVAVANGQLQVDFSGYLFRVIANSEPYVKLESQEIADIFAADRDDREVIASCSARYAVLAPDDPAMDHFNDFLYLLHAFEAAYNGAVAFDSVSGNFL